MSEGLSTCQDVTRHAIDRKLANIYLTFKDTLLNLGYSDEIEWQDSRRLETLSEPEFLAEAAWVILSAGMSAAVIKRIYPQISESYYWWVSAARIAENKEDCERRSFTVFRNLPKIHALSHLCVRVCLSGFDHIVSRLKQDGPSYLSSFHFIGPVTCLHLAKNIGIDVVKPDRHLVRIAHAAGFDTPHEICSKIAELTGDRLSVIDLVLWRYATLHRNYLQPFYTLH
jgi:hypothetical protein